jgi:hypothetical protein
MKNWNDEGTVHYDSETNSLYTTVKVDFFADGGRKQFDLAIPLKIKNALKGEHFDQAINVGRDTFNRIAGTLIAHGANDWTAIDKAARLFSLKAMLEHLYTEFTLVQATAGNQVWATAEKMQDVGPRPEHDFD